MPSVISNDSNPRASVDVRRFRPNLLIETDADAPPSPEIGWVGKEIRAGGVRISIPATCPRCVMPTLQQVDLPQDPGVLRTIVSELAQNLGVYGSVAASGRIRVRVRDELGVDVPVIVSDSFGRPWRWGIVDVAIGVSGLAPLEDLRGSPDHDGRIMRSTVRAVADELASAAELALGKTAGRPVALIRGAAFTRAETGISEVLIPPKADLFR